MKFKDYYAALEVPRDADAETIKKAYRKLARKYHPDVSKEAHAEARFKEVAEAYETLKDPGKRAAYDQLGQRRRPGARTLGSRTSSTGCGTATTSASTRPSGSCTLSRRRTPSCCSRSPENGGVRLRAGRTPWCQSRANRLGEPCVPARSSGTG